MNKQLVAYSMIHEYLLGKYPTAKSYSDRIVAQKIGYLSQSYGIYLGDMKFFWHKRGPYSRSLTSLLFNIENNKQDIIEQSSNYSIRDEMKSRLNKVKYIIEQRPKTCPEVFWLEICASLKFISEEISLNSGIDCKRALLTRKPFLTQYEEDIDLAVALLF